MILTLTDDLDDVEGLSETVESDGGVNAHPPLLPGSFYILEATAPGQAGLSPGTLRLVHHLTFLGTRLITILHT